MKKFALALALMAIASNAQAASITATQTNNAFALTLTGTETNIAALGFSAAPAVGTLFTNPSTTGITAGQPRLAGTDATFRNGRLATAPDNEEITGGLGWTLLNTAATTSILTFEGGPLGSTINVGGSGLFLANLSLNSPTGMAGYTVVLKDANGADIQTITGVVGIPEPASVGLVSMGLLGLAGLRRRFVA